MDKEQLEKRRATIGSSDAPCIMGISPYKSAYQLWEEKVFGKEQSTNPAMKRGNDLEPQARAWFEKKIGLDLPPACLIHPNYSWMSANLDGYNEKKKVLAEIKCTSKANHELAKEGKIPDYYYPQVQHQLEVTGLDNMYYIHFDGYEGEVVEIARDDKYINNLVKEEKKFWDCVLNLEPPELGDLDWINMENDEDWKERALRFKEVDHLLTELEEERDFLRAEFVLFSKGRNAQGCGIKLTKSMTKGAVEYGKIPELENVDLEKYRKASYIKWRTTVLT
jgi:putative phage-type endonuclease